VTPQELVERVKFLQEGKASKNLTEKKNKVLAMKYFLFTLMNRYMYNLGLDDLLGICFLEKKIDIIIEEAHASLVGENFHTEKTSRKIIQARLWWLKFTNIVEKRSLNVTSAKGWVDHYGKMGFLYI